TARGSTAQPASWQDALTRAQGSAVRNQARHNLPAFESRPSAEPASVLRAPAQAVASLSQASRTVPVSAQSAASEPNSTTGHLPEAHAKALTPQAAGFLRGPLAETGLPGLSIEGHHDARAASATALGAALREIERQGESPLLTHTRLTPEGMVVSFLTARPEAFDIEALTATTLAFFSRQGVHVARLVFNGQLIFNGARQADSLQPISRKD
ncbi:MAG: hypothetical protein RIR70_1440, partial [Pseudomonadota bacterium]